MGANPNLILKYGRKLLGNPLNSRVLLGKITKVPGTRWYCCTGWGRPTRNPVGAVGEPRGTQGTDTSTETPDIIWNISWNIWSELFVSIYFSTLSEIPGDAGTCLNDESSSWWSAVYKHVLLFFHWTHSSTATLPLFGVDFLQLKYQLMETKVVAPIGVLKALSCFLVCWDYYSQYMMDKKKCSKPPTSIRYPVKSNLHSVGIIPSNHHLYIKYRPRFPWGVWTSLRRKLPVDVCLQGTSSIHMHTYCASETLPVM